MKSALNMKNHRTETHSHLHEDVIVQFLVPRGPFYTVVLLIQIMSPPGCNHTDTHTHTHSNTTISIQRETTKLRHLDGGIVSWKPSPSVCQMPPSGCARLLFCCLNWESRTYSDQQCCRLW